MTFLVFSDSHGNLASMKEICQKEPHDKLIFLGDYLRDIQLFGRIYPGEHIFAVAGNNDGFTHPEEKIIEGGGLHILCCHGHKYHVKNTYGRIHSAAVEKGCSAALFGHTHHQFACLKDGILLLNPGSIGYKNEYALLKIDNGKAEYQLKNHTK